MVASRVFAQATVVAPSCTRAAAQPTCWEPPHSLQQYPAVKLHGAGELGMASDSAMRITIHFLHLAPLSAGFTEANCNLVQIF